MTNRARSTPQMFATSPNIHIIWRFGVPMTDEFLENQCQKISKQKTPFPLAPFDNVGFRA